MCVVTRTGRWLFIICLQRVVWVVLTPPLPSPLSSADKAKLEREVRVCRMLRHETIVRLHYVFKEANINYLLFDL